MTIASGSAGRVLWFIESHFGGPLDLETIATACGVSRFHMCRSFAAATGMPVMAYLRRRRLTEAARLLAAGAPSILDVALSVGYSSHEAFTRAFGERFGCSPDAVRSGGAVDSTLLVEPIRMTQNQPSLTLDPPRRERVGPLVIAGLGETYSYADTGGIPGQWDRFNARSGDLSETAGPTGYGVCGHWDEAAGRFFYLAGLEVRSARDLPEGFSVMELPARTYLVFAHKGHISEIQAVMQAIWSQSIPEAGVAVAEGEPLFERYGPQFDGRTGRGGFEIWIPLAETEKT